MSEPTLEQYPGFFPAAKKPFWTRAKTGAAAGLVGLLLGVVFGASGEPSVTEDTPAVQALVSERVAEQTEQFDDETAALNEELEETKDAAAAAAASADARIAEAKKAAAKAKRAAERARSQAAEAAAAPPVSTFADTGSTSGGGGAAAGSGSDPIFGTCGEANANGYGDYQQGRDPEYDYYDDRDNDGWVCER